MPKITTNHAITYTNLQASETYTDLKSVLVKGRVDDVDGPALDLNSVPRRIWYQ